MKKQYMDFVPAKTAKSGAQRKATMTTRSGVSVGAAQVRTRSTTRTSTGSRSRVTTSSAVTGAAETMTASGAVTALEMMPVSPVIEEKSVAKKRTVEKAKSPRRIRSRRQKLPEKEPIYNSGAPELMSFDELAAEAQAQRNNVRQTKMASKVDFGGKKANKEVYAVPKPSFINQNKVVKRPLSKNVYQKKVETAPEEPKGPVTIISKTEKDSKTGLIVTIIITVILGAAAGTVAFLLLPK